jgi:hypothetical protein
MFIIVTTSWSHMFIGSEELADKLTIILTMLLTAVAFQFAVSQGLPDKPYSTLIDLYVHATEQHPTIIIVGFVW